MRLELIKVPLLGRTYMVVHSLIGRCGEHTLVQQRT